METDRSPGFRYGTDRRKRLHSEVYWPYVAIDPLVVEDQTKIPQTLGDEKTGDRQSRGWSAVGSITPLFSRAVISAVMPARTWGGMRGVGMRTAPPGRGSESSTTRPLRTIEYVTIVREGRPGGVECLEAAAHRSRGPQRPGTKESKTPAALGRWYGGVVTPAPTPFCPDPGGRGRPTGRAGVRVAWL